LSIGKLAFYNQMRALIRAHTHSDQLQDNNLHCAVSFSAGRLILVVRIAEATEEALKFSSPT